MNDYFYNYKPYSVSFRVQYAYIKTHTIIRYRNFKSRKSLESFISREGLLIFSIKSILKSRVTVKIVKSNCYENK